MSETTIPGMTKQETKEALKRIAVVKLLIQRICTPVPSEKRLAAIRSFFQKNTGQTFSEKENMMIWKGLFYAVWYTEMGKGCEEVIEAIVSACHKSESLLLAGMQTFVNEWKGIDSIRLDKFAFFVRRMTNAMFVLQVRQSRHGQVVQSVVDRIKECSGLVLKFCNVFVQEAIRVFELQPDQFSVIALLSFLRPVIGLLRESQSPVLQATIQREVLIEALVQVTESSFSQHVIRLQEWLNKVLLTFSRSAESRKQQKLMMATIDLVNNEEELKVLFTAADRAAKPKKRSAKQLPGKAKKRRERINL